MAIRKLEDSSNFGDLAESIFKSASKYDRIYIILDRYSDYSNKCKTPGIPSGGQEPICKIVDCKYYLGLHPYCRSVTFVAYLYCLVGLVLGVCGCCRLMVMGSVNHMGNVDIYIPWYCNEISYILDFQYITLVALCLQSGSCVGPSGLCP